MNINDLKPAFFFQNRLDDEKSWIEKISKDFTEYLNLNSVFSTTLEDGLMFIQNKSGKQICAIYFASDPNGIWGHIIVEQAKWLPSKESSQDNRKWIWNENGGIGFEQFIQYLIKLMAE